MGRNEYDGKIRTTQTPPGTFHNPTTSFTTVQDLSGFYGSSYSLIHNQCLKYQDPYRLITRAICFTELEENRSNWQCSIQLLSPHILETYKLPEFERG